MHYWCGEPKLDLPPEIAGGYLWPPKRSANGARNPLFELMRELAPGDRHCEASRWKTSAVMAGTQVQL
jgi:hypothetical protein